MMLRSRSSAAAEPDESRDRDLEDGIVRPGAQQPVAEPCATGTDDPDGQDRVARGRIKPPPSERREQLPGC
jgi:hypothetical protein